MKPSNSGTVKSSSLYRTGNIIPLLISCARVVDIEVTLLCKLFATFDIVHGNSPHFTIAKINFLSISEHRSYLTLKNPVSRSLKNTDILLLTSLSHII